MKRKSVFISGPAKKDILRIVRYIRLDKPVAAEQFKGLLKQRIRSLKTLFQRGRKVPELKGTIYADYRELIVEPCRIVYKLKPQEVHILRVLHSRSEFRLEAPNL